MLKISLYQNFWLSLCEHIKTHSYRKNQSYTTDRPTTSAFGRGLSPRQEPCIPYALSRSTSEIHGSNLGTSRNPDRNDPYISQFLGETFRVGRCQRLGNTAGTRSEANHGPLGRRSRVQSHRERHTEHEESERGMAAGFRERCEREYLQSFFIRLGTGYRRIRKRPKGKPSPPLYAYKTEKLQELKQQEKDGLIDLYYGDESHICTEGYVLYGWQFRGEDVYILSERGLRPTFSV